MAQAQKQSGRQERIEERVYRSALRVVKLVQVMPRGVAGEVLARQLLRAATSIGANVEEAIAAESKRDFTHKMSIAHKEARETHYWLRLVRDAEMFSPERMCDSIQESLEIKKILSATVRTSRASLEK